MTKKEFTAAVKKVGGTTSYSGSNKEKNKATMYVNGLNQTQFNKHFGRHFGMAVNFKIVCNG